MSVVKYSAIYYDIYGSIDCFIENNGRELKVVLRDVEFRGSEFDSLSPMQDTDPELLNRFTLSGSDLCACRIECQIPIMVQYEKNDDLGMLFVEIVLGDPGPKGGTDREEVRIVFEMNGQRWNGSGNSGWFEDELLSIQKKLPDGMFIKSCINCLYSDYSPAGHGAYGWMMCFRNIKQEYLEVKSKADFWAIHDHYDQIVQETYLCNEFERRIAGTGYRG